MSSGPTLRDIVDSSVVARQLGGVVRRSAAGIRHMTAWVSQTNTRILIGLRGTAPAEAPREQFDAVLADSRVVRLLNAVVDAPILAWEHSAARRLADGFLAMPVDVRVRLIGVAVIAAVVTHTIGFALLRVRVFALGWSFRAGLIAAGLVLVSRPGIFAAAWRDWRSR